MKKNISILILLMAIVIVIVFMANSMAMENANMLVNLDNDAMVYQARDYDEEYEYADLPSREDALLECALIVSASIKQVHDICSSHVKRNRYMKSHIYHAFDMFIETGYFPEITSWVDPALGVIEYNEFCRQRELMGPSIPVREYVRDYLTRTIHFQFEDGRTAADSVVQKIAVTTFVRDLISNQEHVIVEPIIFESVPIPVINPPSNNYIVESPGNFVPEVIKYTGDDDSVFTVVFRLIDLDVDIGDDTSNNNDNEDVGVPDTFASRILYVYIVGTILVVAGSAVLLTNSKKENDVN